MHRAVQSPIHCESGPLLLCCLLFLGGLGVVEGGWSGGSGGVKFSVRKAIAFKLKHKLAGLSFILG